jgi:circadian clock protein KaiC
MESRSGSLPKSLTGVEGLDEILHGGLPTGRTTLIAGGAGCGKTVLAAEFLLNGILKYNEPGVFISFEETEKDLTENVASFGYDIDALQVSGKLAIDHVFAESYEIEETGSYNLDGLFIRLANAIDSVNAKRVVLDTIEVLFSALQNQSVVRSELARLFRWLKKRGITAIVTCERGEGTLTRFGIEEYVSDCVILLDHRVTEQISTRRIRIVKYRGSSHEMDEHPFLMSEQGITVLPVTSVGLAHGASLERISSGVTDIDTLLSGKGFFRGSSILLCGTSGLGKTSLALTFLKAACERSEQSLYFGFEESSEQIIRNMNSIGLDLQPVIDKGLLRFNTVRPSSLGLEAHLGSIMQTVRKLRPKVLAIDPISEFIAVSEQGPVKSMLTRLVDFLKKEQITTMFTHLSRAGEIQETTNQRLSSIMDAWLLLRDVEYEGRRTSALYILKARGMAHSRELRRFNLSESGIHLGGISVHSSQSASSENDD